MKFWTTYQSSTTESVFHFCFEYLERHVVIKYITATIQVCTSKQHLRFEIGQGTLILVDGLESMHTHVGRSLDRTVTISMH